MDELKAFISQNFAYILLFNCIISLVFGIICVVIGGRRGRRNLGIVGGIVSVVVGIPSWVLGLISAAIFVSIIFIKSSKGSTSDLQE
jgi:ABC-type dipeptide/oligopeptide/nickel transport system permease component